MRHCEVDKLRIDLPCGRRAKHFLKIQSKRLGDKTKFKVWLCDFHMEFLRDRLRVTDVLGQGVESSVNSKNYKATMFEGVRRNH